MKDMVWSFLSPIISLLPAFTVLITIMRGWGAWSYLMIIVLIAYYFFSRAYESRAYENLFAVVNFVLWIVGFVLIIFIWPASLKWYLALYVLAFAYLIIHGLRARRSGSY